MPFKMFKRKALELIESYQNPQNDILPFCDTLIEDLSAFFIVSRVSVKYRLIEVGLLDQISNFEDFDAVFSEITDSKELVALTPVEAYQLLNLDSSLREWVSGGRFVFADGYFVLAVERYITVKEDALICKAVHGLGGLRYEYNSLRGGTDEPRRTQLRYFFTAFVRPDYLFR